MCGIMNEHTLPLRSNADGKLLQPRQSKWNGYWHWQIASHNKAYGWKQSIIHAVYAVSLPSLGYLKTRWHQTSVWEQRRLFKRKKKKTSSGLGFQHVYMQVSPHALSQRSTHTERKRERGELIHVPLSSLLRNPSVSGERTMLKTRGWVGSGL